MMTKARPVVLVVENSKLIRMLTVLMVRELGCDALEAASAEEAIEIAGAYQPDVVISDALLPRIDGHDMCRTIKNEYATRSTKVILMTSLFRQPRYRYESCNTFGVDEYVQKPPEKTELRAAIERVMDARVEEEVGFEIVA